MSSPNEETEMSGPAVPWFPNEIFYKVLSFVDAKELIWWRLVSRNWNEIASNIVFQKELPVKFFRKIPYDEELEDVDTTLHEFLHTVESRTLDVFPFSAFEFFLYDTLTPSGRFTPSITSINNFFTLLGPLVKRYSVHIENFYEGDLEPVFECLLANSPNLETLCVYGQDTDVSTTLSLNSTFQLRRLKHIVIMPYSPEISYGGMYFDPYVPSRLRFDQFASWVFNAPVLRVLRLGFGIKITSEAEAKSFFKLLKIFDLVELELKVSEDAEGDAEDMPLLKELSQSSLSTLHSLFLDVYDQSELIYSCLEGVSKTLKKLNLQLQRPLTNKIIPILYSLETLEISLDVSCYRINRELDSDVQYPLNSYLFPVLKTVTLITVWKSDRYPNDSNYLSLFAPTSVFPTVEFLNMVSWEEEQPRSWRWKLLFPNSKYSISEDWPTPWISPKNKKIFSMRQLNDLVGLEYSSNAVRSSKVLRPMYTTLDMY